MSRKVPQIPCIIKDLLLLDILDIDIHQWTFILDIGFYIYFTEGMDIEWTCLFSGENNGGSKIIFHLINGLDKFGV